MIRSVLGRISAVMMAATLLACSSPRPMFEAMPQIKLVEVACVQIKGDLPQFTQKTCKDLADRVRQGIEEFNELTGEVVELPSQVRPRLLSGTTTINNALALRCINYTSASADQKASLRRMVVDITNATLERVRIDPTQTALVVAVNASPSLCRNQLPPNFTDRCPEGESSRAFLGGQALHRATNQPVVFIFASPDEPALDLSLARHEWGHLGIKTEQLGHDLALCSHHSDQLPSLIDESTVFGTDIRSWKASIMSYSHYAPEVYVAPPHLAQLGLIEESRILIPEESGIVSLGDAPQTGAVAPGSTLQAAAALQLELDSPAIKKAIAPEVSKSKTKLPVDDYVLFVGRVSPFISSSTASGDPDEVAVYATPTPEQLRISDEDAPIFLVQRLGVGERLDIAQGPSIHVLSSHDGVVQLDVQLAT